MWPTPVQEILRATCTALPRGYQDDNMRCEGNRIAKTLTINASEKAFWSAIPHEVCLQFLQSREQEFCLLRLTTLAVCNLLQSYPEQID